MNKNDMAPHRAIIWVETIVYEVLPTGELSGLPVESRKDILSIEGADKHICLRKTNEFLEEMKQCSKQK